MRVLRGCGKRRTEKLSLQIDEEKSNQWSVMSNKWFSSAYDDEYFVSDEPKNRNRANDAETAGSSRSWCNVLGVDADATP